MFVISQTNKKIVLFFILFFRFVVLDGYDISILGWPPEHPHRAKALKILSENNPNEDKNSPNGLDGYQQYDPHAFKKYLKKQLFSSITVSLVITTFVSSHGANMFPIPLYVTFASPSFLPLFTFHHLCHN